MNTPVPQCQPKSTADALRDAHASFLGPAYDRSIFLEAAAEIASLKADNEQLRRLLTAARQFVSDGGCDEEDMEVHLGRLELVEAIDAALSPALRR